MLKLAQTRENKHPETDFSIYLPGGRHSIGGVGLLPDLKHFSELCQFLLMGSDAILALSQPAHALRFVQPGWLEASIASEAWTTHTTDSKQTSPKRTDFL